MIILFTDWLKKIFEANESRPLTHKELPSYGQRGQLRNGVPGTLGHRQRPTENMLVQFSTVRQAIEALAHLVPF